MKVLKHVVTIVLLVAVLFTALGVGKDVKAASTIRFAVIGDIGVAGQGEADVATLVKSWNPDFIIALGDNNYPSGAAATIDANIGQYYHEYISPYVGSYGAGSVTNRFYPILGNHDLDTLAGQAYFDYFTLPNNERYYDIVQGPVHIIALDSDPREPDGNTESSVQGTWFSQTISASTSPWQLVLMHHPPYSSSTAHGSSLWMQWDFKGMGADVVMAGHDHAYERLSVDGVTYFVNGSGGAPLYQFGTPIAGSQFQYDDDYGAMLVTASDTEMNFKFYNRGGTLIDEYTLVNSVFSDVPSDYWAKSWIERLYNSSITGGCSTSPLSYCPTSPVTRAQMAVFLLKGIHGASYTPPAVNGSTGFNDVPVDHWAAAWIKQLAAESITGGCGGGNYCPEDTVTRDQMAVFLLKAKYGGSYTPPTATGTVFTDVNSSYWAADWIEQLASEGTTSGCSAGVYCPTAAVARDQMAVFLVKTFNLP